jgi:hypothetical protein
LLTSCYPATPINKWISSFYSGLAARWDVHSQGVQGSVGDVMSCKMIDDGIRVIGGAADRAGRSVKKEDSSCTAARRSTRGHRNDLGSVRWTLH